FLDFARTRQPEIREIDITSRGYWYEQYRRAEFDFDSQSVRPYFPYQQVEAGIDDQAGVGRRAVLVGDHAQFVALGAEPQHGAQEVVAVCGIDPGGAQG